MNIYTYSKSSVAIASALIFAASAFVGTTNADVDCCYTGGYDPGYVTGGYNAGYVTGGYDGGYTVGGYDGGYVTGGYDNGFLTNGYDGGFVTGGYDGGYVTGGYDGGYTVGGYDGGYVTGGYDGGYVTGGYDGGYVTGGYDGSLLGCDSWCYSDYVSDCGGCGYSYRDSSGWYSSPIYSSGGGYSVSAPRSYSVPTYHSTPISVSSGRSYVQPTTPVVVSGGGTTHNNNNNVNNNTNVNNISVSATAIAIAPAPVATPVAAYIPPAPMHPAPYCTISIANQYGLGYGYGQQTLSWNSTNAHSASISPMIGGVTTNGSRIVSYAVGTVYTMTVWGPGGSATCQTQPMYVAPVPVPAPTTPYVALTQIPYTGFDYGPVGNAMYWVSLALVAFAGAYLMVYFRGGMFAFAGSMIGGRSQHRSSRLAEFTPLPESAFAPAKKTVARADVKAGYTNTSDTMSVIRSESGAPKIVISRA